MVLNPENESTNAEVDTGVEIKNILLNIARVAGVGVALFFLYQTYHFLEAYQSLESLKMELWADTVGDNMVRNAEQVRQELLNNVALSALVIGLLALTFISYPGDKSEDEVTS